MAGIRNRRSARWLLRRPAKRATLRNSRVGAHRGARPLGHLAFDLWFVREVARRKGRANVAPALTLQSRGRAPASRVTPLISNVGHHDKVAMLSGLHSLRSASNEMPPPFSASSGQSTKYLARFSRHRRSAAMALTRCYALRPWSHVVGSFHPSACGVGGGCCSASNQRVVGTLRRRAAPGGQPSSAAEYRCSFLSLRACGGVRVAKSAGGFVAFAGTGPCQRVMPNPSINRTCPGKPGHAGYLKRWASR
jgi:hypothetical protein